MKELDWLGSLTLVALTVVAVQYVAIKCRLHGTSGLILGGIVVSLLGPHGTQLIGKMILGEVEITHLIAEIAVGFLLLEVGMELSIQRILRMWKIIFIGGAFQMALTSTVTVFAYLTFLGGSLTNALFLGVLVTMSSTVVVFKWLQENNLLHLPFGSFLVGVLLFQDISLLPLAMLVPIFGDGGATLSEMLTQILGSACILSIVFALEFHLIHHFLYFARVHKNKHFFKLAIVAVCLLNVSLLSQFNLSPALGMFVSGLLISGTQYRNEVFGNVEKFTGFLTPCFFIYIGTLFNPQLFLVDGSKSAMIVLSLAAMLTIKLASGFIAARMLRLNLEDSIRASGALAQIGELSFVLAGLGLASKALSPDNFEILICLMVLSILLTPLTMKTADRVADRVKES